MFVSRSKKTLRKNGFYLRKDGRLMVNLLHPPTPPRGPSRRTSASGSSDSSEFIAPDIVCVLQSNGAPRGCMGPVHSHLCNSMKRKSACPSEPPCTCANTCKHAPAKNWRGQNTKTCRDPVSNVKSSHVRSLPLGRQKLGDEYHPDYCCAM